MNKLLILLLAFVLSKTTIAQVEVPRPSPKSILTQDFGLTEVKIEYFRPKLKGRKIFGSGEEYLLQYGEIWRTGANGGTIISFEDTIEIGAQKIPGGKYQVLSIPGEKEWQVMLYPETIGGNMTKYQEDKATAIYKVKPKKLDEAVQTLTISIDNISEDNTTAILTISWENTELALDLKIDFDGKVLASIEKHTKVDPYNYARAASYYLETGRDLEQALEWMELSLVDRPWAFWDIYRKALIQKELGKTKEAIATAEESLKLAEENKDGDFGYIARNKKLIEELK